MTTKLTRAAYEKLIAEDLSWLEKQPRTLEREHVKEIVARSSAHEYSGDLKEMSAALGVDESWPAADVLTRLAAAAEHLLKDHACDAHGYEEVSRCIERARVIAIRIRETFKKVTPP